MVVAGRPEGEEQHGLVVLLLAMAMAVVAVLGGRNGGGVVLVRVSGSVAVHDDQKFSEEGLRGWEGSNKCWRKRRLALERAGVIGGGGLLIRERELGSALYS